MPIGPRKIGSPEISPPRGTATTAPAAPVAKPAVTPFAPPASAAPVAAPAGLGASTAATAAKRTAALQGVSQPAPPVSASVAIAFDAIKAPGGPAKARILDDGLDAWNARMDLIENAKTSIDASYFIVEKDPYGFAFLGGLLKKQLEGVPVRMSIDAMADTFGTHGFKAPLKGQDYLQELVNHGGEASVYHPVYERPLDALKGDYSVLASNHDKILVADGKVGITGGRNIAQDYYANPKDMKGAWRENPYVVLTQDMLGALERASKRGVEVDIITNSPLSTDSDVTQAFFLDDWKMILARCPTAHVYVATGDRKFHTKSAVIDDEESVVSTYNLDLLSGFVNGEVGAVVKSKELASDLLHAFEHDRADPANGFIEYTIAKDAEGNAVLKDGQPVTVFGPENHLPADVLETYRKKSNLWGNFVRNHVPQFKPLRHDG